MTENEFNIRESFVFKIELPQAKFMPVSPQTFQIVHDCGCVITKHLTGHGDIQFCEEHQKQFDKYRKENNL